MSVNEQAPCTFLLNPAQLVNGLFTHGAAPLKEPSRQDHVRMMAQ
ncbi:hypothetical protein SSTU70S_05657 [Stutzerimonas stutzeri]